MDIANCVLTREDCLYGIQWNLLNPLGELSVRLERLKCTLSDQKYLDNQNFEPPVPQVAHDRHII